MSRRLFFLFPDTEHAQRVVDELLTKGVRPRHIHAIAKGADLGDLPEATERQKKDIKFRVAWFIWNTNLVLFATALFALVASLVASSVAWALVSLLIMALTFLAGEQFAVKIPDVQLTEFTDALSHGEVLLMIDVPKHQVAEIEDHVHHRHPEASVGGVGWTMNALNM
jgi:hypothetical protein